MCTNTATTVLDNLSALNKLEIDNSLIHIFPNPARNEIEIDSNFQFDYMQIFDTKGLLKISSHAIEGVNRTKVDISTLSAGLHWINLSDAHGVQRTVKFVKC